MATLEQYLPRLQPFIESQTGYTTIKLITWDCIYRSLCMIAYQKMVGGLWEGQVYLVGHIIVFCLDLRGAKVITGRACLFIQRFLLTFFSNTNSQWRTHVGIRLCLAGPSASRLQYLAEALLLLHPGAVLLLLFTEFNGSGDAQKDNSKMRLVWNIIHAYSKLSLIKYQQQGAQLVIASRENQVK